MNVKDLTEVQHGEMVEFIPSDFEIADQIYEYSGGYSDEEALKHYKAGIEWILSKIHPKK